MIPDASWTRADLITALAARDEACTARCTARVAGLRQALDVLAADLAGARAENARLRAELDAHGTADVHLLPTRSAGDLRAAMYSHESEPDGTVIRRTARAQDWVRDRSAPGGWAERR